MKTVNPTSFVDKPPGEDVVNGVVTQIDIQLGIRETPGYPFSGLERTGKDRVTLTLVVSTSNLDQRNALYQAMVAHYPIQLHFPAVRGDGPVYDGEVVYGKRAFALTAGLSGDGGPPPGTEAEPVLPTPGR